MAAFCRVSRRRRAVPVGQLARPICEDDARMRQVQLPSPEWSARSFPSREAACRFHQQLITHGFAPAQADEDMVGPSGEVIRAGSWVVIYQVFT